MDFIVKWFGMSASRMTKQQFAYNAEEGLKQLDLIVKWFGMMTRDSEGAKPTAVAGDRGVGAQPRISSHPIAVKIPPIFRNGVG